MKKILSFVLVLALLIISVPTGIFAVSAAAADTTYKVGDIIEFGNYKQSAIKNANGETTGFNVEPLKWRILKIENGKALLLTEEVIDNKYYNSTSATVDGYYGNNYAHSDIREWLINDFYNVAFSSAEKNCILATTLDNSAAPTSVNASGSYTKYSSESTTDKVFLLSKDEANTYASKYFRTTATDYALSLGYQLYSGAGSIVGDNWTLRTAGNNTYQIYTVHVRWGEHVTYFNWYDDTITTPRGVRPAIYLDLENTADIGRDETPFDLTTDGYSFANSMSAFEYNIFSKIPLEAYYDVYGEKGKQLRKSDSTWGGSCFGMSATAALFNDGILNLNNYINDPINLNVSAYSGTKKNILNGTHFNYIDKKQEVKKLIDKYQIWQNSIEGKKWLKTIIWQAANIENNQISGDLSNVLKYYDNYIVGLWWEGGAHAVVIDSDRTPLYLGNGWYRIYIYDPNNPYFGDFNGRKSESCYNYAQSRYIDVNIITNHWKVDVGVNSNSSSVRVGYDNNDNYISGCEIDICVPSLLPTSFNGTAEWYYSSNCANTATLNCENAIMYDSDNNILFKVEDNKVVYLDSSINADTSINAPNEYVINSYIIELPFDEFTIEFNSEGTAQVFNEEYCYGIVSDAEGCATITTSKGISVEGDENSTVDVVIEQVNDDDTFTSVNVVVENDGQNQVYISLDDNNELYVDSVTDNFDATVYWNGQENEYLLKNITTSNIQNIDITEYAQSTGEIVPNDIIDADIAYQNVFVYDGNQKNINPVVEYQGKTLELGVDYIIEGNMNESATGTYSATLIGQGKYCGTSVIEYKIIPQIGFKGASLTLQNDLSVNYIVDESLFSEDLYTSPYVVFEINGVKTTVKNYSKSDNGYKFTFSNISPDKMNDKIHATLYAQYNGAEYASATREYSIAEYCYSMLNYYSTDAYANLRTLLVDLLNYGAYTQNYTGHNTENLVNANLTDEQKAWASGDIETFTDVLNTKYATVDNPTVKWRGAELELNSAITMKFLIQTDSIEGLTVKITDDNGHSWTVKSSTFKKYADGYYYVYFNGLDASQMSDNIYLTVYSSNTIVSNTVRYSIESYASAMKDSTNDKLSTLVHSMMKYGNSAKQYKNKGVN